MVCFVATSGKCELLLMVGPNINITQSLSNNAEECIAVNPANPQSLFASDTWTLASRYSTNAGVTWSDSDTSLFPAYGTDVAAAWDEFGNLFLARSGSQGAVGVSTNGGATFRIAYQFPLSGTDQPNLAVGPSSVPGQGSAWVVYVAAWIGLRGASVTGLGAIGSFTPAEYVIGDFALGGMAVGPTGQVIVVYQDASSGTGQWEPLVPRMRGRLLRHCSNATFGL
jgi:hypothetical protein